MTPGQRPIARIACIGEVMIELVAEGDDIARMNVAGDTYNTAVYLVRLLQGAGVCVSYVTALGRDRYSDRILAHMQAHGVCGRRVERRSGKVPGLYAIDTDPDGERSFTYWRSDSAARTMFSAPAEIGLEVLDQFDLVFLSGITLAILPPPVRAALMQALCRFRAGGGQVAYDSNHRPRLWESGQVARAVNNAMWAQTDIALPSVDDEMEIHTDADGAAVLARLRGADLCRGALKRGAAGPVGLAGDKAPHEFPRVERIVDTTAAGDSFNAGFLAAVARGRSGADAMMAGHLLASKVIQARGAIIPL